MALVQYSDSDSEEDSTTPPSKRRKTSGHGVDELPALPASFLDQYSSTVRTSKQDDPSLHGGRKRATPHVQGNWPTHVCLELQQRGTGAAENLPRQPESKDRSNEKNPVHSLLENDLGVSLPLHISLSRPLALATTQKDSFLAQLTQAVADAEIKAFMIRPKDLAWHPNEGLSRWSLVLRLQHTSGMELSRLLDTCNATTRKFGQPLLYAATNESGNEKSETDDDQFHISLAWSLSPPQKQDVDSKTATTPKTAAIERTGVPYKLLGQLGDMCISFTEVKVRIGQDVHNIALKPRR